MVLVLTETNWPEGNPREYKRQFQTTRQIEIKFFGFLGKTIYFSAVIRIHRICWTCRQDRHLFRLVLLPDLRQTKQDTFSEQENTFEHITDWQISKQKNFYGLVFPCYSLVVLIDLKPRISKPISKFG